MSLIAKLGNFLLLLYLFFENINFNISNANIYWEYIIFLCSTCNRLKCNLLPGISRVLSGFGLITVVYIIVVLLPAAKIMPDQQLYKCTILTFYFHDFRKQIWLSEWDVFRLFVEKYWSRSWWTRISIRKFSDQYLMCFAMRITRKCRTRVLVRWKPNILLQLRTSNALSLIWKKITYFFCGFYIFVFRGVINGELEYMFVMYARKVFLFFKEIKSSLAFIQAHRILSCFIVTWFFFFSFRKKKKKKPYSVEKEIHCSGQRAIWSKR